MGTVRQFCLPPSEIVFHSLFAHNSFPNYIFPAVRFFNSQPKTLSEKDITSGFVYSPSSYEENWQESSARPTLKEKERKDIKSQRKSKGSGGGSGEAGGGVSLYIC